MVLDFEYNKVYDKHNRKCSIGGIAVQNLIKSIRLHVGFSQQELADKLEVSIATINRWENTNAAPNKHTQIKLYEFCKENDICRNYRREGLFFDEIMEQAKEVKQNG